MNKLILSLTLLATALCAQPARAADPTTAPSATQPSAASATLKPATLELLAHIQSQLKTVESLEADFVQEKKLSVLKHTLTIHGHFAVQKPDRVVWIVRDPVRYAIRVEGAVVHQWDEDTNKVQVIHLGGDPTFKAISEQIQAWFLGDYKSLESSYDAFVVSEKPLSLRFAPKGKTMVAKLIQYIEVTFGSDEKMINQMVIRESSGDNTVLNYVNTRLNQPIKAEIWEIPPK